MANDLILIVAVLGLALYSTWAARRDLKTGRASSTGFHRGFHIDRETDPGPYRARMMVSIGSFAVLWMGVVVLVAPAVWHRLSH